MNPVPAGSPALPPPAENWPAGPKPPTEGWTRKKFFFVLAFILAFHVAAIFLFGTKKQPVPRVVTNVPHLTLANNADELIALGDPTLFARPNTHDPATAFWRRMPAVAQPNFNWTEPPRYLAPAPADFGRALGDYVRQSMAAEFPLNFKPEPRLLTQPEVALDVTLPQTTTLRFSGGLATRRLLNTVDLPSLPRNDVIAPSRIHATVDAEGNVISVVVWPQTSFAGVDWEPGTDNAADQLALQLARNLRFAPATDLSFGQIIFVWHTVPLTSTNANQ